MSECGSGRGKRAHKASKEGCNQKVVQGRENSAAESQTAGFNTSQKGHQNGCQLGRTLARGLIPGVTQGAFVLL